MPGSLGAERKWFTMRRFWIGLAALAVLPAAAVARDEGSNCGGDAYSFAEVVPARAARITKGH